MSPMVPSLAEVFAAIPDPRHARGTRHPLVALLLLTGVAIAGTSGDCRLGQKSWRTVADPPRVHPPARATSGNPAPPFRPYRGGSRGSASRVVDATGVCCPALRRECG